MLRYAVRVSQSNGRLVREIIAPGMFVALILASNFALAGLPNVKFFDLLVFVAGFTLGFRRGMTVAVVAWVVYDVANPWGPAGAALLLTEIGSEFVYAVAGGIMGRLVPADKVSLGPSRNSIILTVIALMTTFAYDLATNVYTGWAWAGITGGHDYSHWIGVALFGPGALLFMALHIGSNLVLFPVFGPLLIQGADLTKRALGWE